MTEKTRYVGNGTPSAKIKKMWHDAKRPGTLKSFVRSVKDLEVAKLWLANKRGKNNTKKAETTVRRCKETSQATKLSKKKKKNEGGSVK